MRLFYCIYALFFITIYSTSAQSCMEFNNLNGIYGPNGPNGTPAWYEVFHTEGDIELSAQGFQHPGGNVDGAAFVSANQNQFSGAFTMANGVFLKTAPTSAMIYSFPASDTVTFNFMDWNSEINFAVNNEAVIVTSDFQNLPSNVAPGVTFSVEVDTIGAGIQGLVTLTGYITKVIVGGDNLGIDNFCQNTDPSQTCLINQINAMTQACDNGQFMTVIDLIYTDGGNLGFNVSANGINLGDFSYSSLPITVGPLPGDNTTDWTFTVSDIENTYCTNNENVGVVNCPICSIDNLLAAPDVCASDSTFFSYIEFTASNPTSSFYDLIVDGVPYGSFPYAQVPYFGELPSSSSTTMSIMICDGGTSCCAETFITPVDCAPPAVCTISSMEVIPACIPGGGDMFTPNLIYTVENPVSDSFYVSVDGVPMGSYSYTETVVLLPDLIGDGFQAYTFTMVDAADPNCTANFTLFHDCSPCDLNGLVADSLFCDSDSTYSMAVNLPQGGGNGNSFSLFLNGAPYGSFPYASLPLYLGGLPGNGQTAFLQVCDQNDPNCCTDYTYTAPSCTPPPCDLANLTVMPDSCYAGNFDAVVNFNPINPVGTTFSVSANGSNYGSYLYSSLPITIFGLVGDGTTNYEFFVVDDLDSTCTAGVNIGTYFCAPPEPCEITSMFVDGFCDGNDMYEPNLYFTVDNPVSDSFNVEVNGIPMGSYSYAQSPAILPDVVGDGFQVYNITMTDAADPNCTESFMILPDCSPCVINNLTASVGDCDNMGLFDVTLDFEVFQPDGPTFSVYIDQSVYGPYNYTDVPVTVFGLVGDSSITYSIGIIDDVQQNCQATIAVGPVDCSILPSCDLSGLSADSLFCDSDSTYSMMVDLVQSGATGSSFNLSLDGVPYGNFSYASLPLYLSGLPTSAGPVTLQVCDQANPNCCTNVSYLTPSCSAPLLCEISDFYPTWTQCNGTEFDVIIDFTVINPTSSTFNLYGNGNFYGTYNYTDLPIYLSGFAGDNFTVYDFVVEDINDPNCSAFGVVGPVDCQPDCVFESITVDSLVCTSDSNYMALININYSGTTSSSFELTIAGQSYGTYSYNALPIWVSGLGMSGFVSGYACDADQAIGCCADFFYTAPDCTPAPVCEIGTLSVQALPCDQFGKYNAMLDFAHSNTSTSFKVYSNGANYGTFNYADLPVQIGAFIGDGTNYSIEVEDVGPLAGCGNGTTLQGVNCPVACDISAVEAEALACTSDSTYSLFLDFNYTGNVSNQFKVTASNGTVVGTYGYNQLPVTISDFPSYGATPETVTINDVANSNCLATKTFEPLSCLLLPCEIGMLTVTPINCTSDSSYLAIVDFEVANPMDSVFTVTDMNGNNIGVYSYAALPVTIELPSFGNTTETVTVCDMTSPNCCAALTFDALVCAPMDCELFNLEVTPFACDSINGQFMMSLDVDVAVGGSTFDVFVNGASAGTYNYAILPVTIGPFDGDGVTTWNVNVTDSDSPNCTTSTIVDPVDCGVGDCELSNLVVEAIECTSPNTIALAIVNLDFANVTGGFDVFSSVGYVGFYDYAALPFTITNYTITPGEMIETIVICDAQDLNCCIEMDFSSLNCTPVVCSLDSMVVTTTPCDSLGNVNAIVDLMGDNTSDSFSLVGNGINYGTYNYADLPVTVGPFAGDEVTMYELQAVDVMNPNCTTFTTFGPIDCIMNCELSDLAVEPSLCTSDTTYTLQLQFNTQDVSAAGFEVFAQGTFIGTYSYADLPLEIEDFPILASSTVQLSVCDLQNPNCCISAIYEAPDCNVSNECVIYEVVATPLDCDLGLFAVEIDLEYENPGTLGFQVFGNGVNYGNFSYADLPITLFDFIGDGVTEYEFIAVDLIDTECLNFANIEAVDCVDDCQITNLEVMEMCDDSTFTFMIDFDYNNVSTTGFIVNGNGVIYGMYNYADLPIEIGPFDQGDQTNFEFVVTDVDAPICAEFIAYGQVDCTTSSVEDFVETNTSIRYDFINENIFISLEEAMESDARIEIYNAAGSKLHESTLSAGQMERQIPMTEFASGWYLVRLISEEGQTGLPFVKAR